MCVNVRGGLKGVQRAANEGSAMGSVFSCLCIDQMRVVGSWATDAMPGVGWKLDVEAMTALYES